jgi:peroxiredoxin Q/BCP
VLEPGDEVLDFELPNQDGDPVRLSDRAGRTVLSFYPGADTPGCTAAACGFRDNWAASERRGFDVLAVSDDPVSDLADFAETYDLPVELLSDQDGAAASRYDSYGERNVFGNVVQGVFRNTFVVNDGAVERPRRRRARIRP